MQINKEQALRLWTKQFGRKIKVTDYAGRSMDKSAYNNRSSRFGWNVDHILPQSKGGKTADHNLICCNIQTNDEKADRFPCFHANGQSFEIRRCQNHYEIFPQNSAQTHHPVNFFDAGQVIEYWEAHEEIPAYTFVGYVKINLTSPKVLENTFVMEFKNFLSNLFHTSAVFMAKSYFTTMNCMSDYTFTVIVFDVPRKADTQNLLDECVLLNTYGQFYFQPQYDCTLRIYCGMKPYPTETGFSADNITRDILNRHCASLGSCYLAIHGMIKTNTSADQEIDDTSYHSESYISLFDKEGFFPYNKLAPNVKKILEKQFKKH